MRLELRNDSTAYGYSLLITTVFGALSASGTTTVRRVVLFAVGASLAFTGLEAAASKMFRQRIRSERSDVVLLGSALHFGSVLAGLGVTAGIAALWQGWEPWLIAPFAATTVYVTLTGANLAAATAIEERDPPREKG